LDKKSLVQIKTFDYSKWLQVLKTIYFKCLQKYYYILYINFGSVGKLTQQVIHNPLWEYTLLSCFDCCGLMGRVINLEFGF